MINSVIKTVYLMALLIDNGLYLQTYLFRGVGSETWTKKSRRLEDTHKFIDKYGSDK